LLPLDNFELFTTFEVKPVRGYTIIKLLASSVASSLRCCAWVSLIRNTELDSRTKLLPVSVGCQVELGLGVGASGLGLELGLGLGLGLWDGVSRPSVCAWVTYLGFQCQHVVAVVRSFGGSACVLLFMFTLIKVKGSRDWHIVIYV